MPINFVYNSIVYYSTLMSFDPGMLYVEKGFDELKPIFERCDILLINESELRLLFNDEASLKELAVGLLDFGIGTIVIKQGAKGVFAMSYIKNGKTECIKSDPFMNESVRVFNLICKITKRTHLYDFNDMDIIIERDKKDKK